VSSSEGSNVDAHFLTAEGVELRPLIAEAEASLALDAGGIADLEIFLSEAWFSGVRAGHTQMLTRATERKAPMAPIDMKACEAEFQSLMERSAEAMDLSVARTIAAWGLLGRAWLAGTRSYQSEIAARMLERESDIGAEALEWLDETGR
jgi:hypothetical protein